VERIRILLVGVPPLMADILRGSAEPDVAVVGERRADGDLVEALDEVAANAVIVGTAEPGLPSAAALLFSRRPAVKVVGITGDARRATLYELRLQRQIIGEVSPSELVGAIRAAVVTPAEAW
jgi:DNA-binding NarL/FixJ family response regulator